ncbi:MAG TPA: hypothetical protein VG963_12235, partial [Polyangiaceae bacterium]|nr:hypothetical protein [Polyangiaceae bacterium]
MTHEAQGAAGETRALGSGGYARREVAIDPARGSEGALELALAPAFGALFSALLAPRKFRVRKLSLEFVAPERLGSTATYSARLGTLVAGGQACELSLVIANGAFLCAHGEAVLELASPEARPAHSKSGLNGNGLDTSSGREK